MHSGPERSGRQTVGKGRQVHNRGGQPAVLPRTSHLHGKAQGGPHGGPSRQGAGFAEAPSLHCSLDNQACKPGAPGNSGSWRGERCKQQDFFTHCWKCWKCWEGVSSPEPAGQEGARVEGTPSTPPGKRIQGQGSAYLPASKASPPGRLSQFRALRWISGQGSRNQRVQGPPFRSTYYHCQPESPRASGEFH